MLRKTFLFPLYLVTNVECSFGKNVQIGALFIYFLCLMSSDPDFLTEDFNEEKIKHFFTRWFNIVLSLVECSQHKAFGEFLLLTWISCI